MQTRSEARAVPRQQVERVLARFELACPALRDYQVAVQILERTPQLVLLPAAGRPRGTIEFVVTPRGRLRTCQTPPSLTRVQLATVEDLAWALYEALSERAPQPLPTSS